MHINKEVNLLICDDDPTDRKLIKSYLHQDKWYKFGIQEAEDEDQITNALERDDIDLIILDYQLPGKTGLEWLREIKERKIAPTIVLTGHGNELIAAEVFNNGACDYLPKYSLSTENLNKGITNALDKWNLVKQLIDYRTKLEYLVRTDDLTGLANRRYLIDSLNLEINRGMRYQHPLSIIILDIDEFKNVNDIYGHLAGDKVLIKVADIIQANARNTDIPGRYGGDEFVIILPETSLTDAKVIAERIRSTVEEKVFSVHDSDFFITISSGLAEMAYKHTDSEDYELVDCLINKADECLYRVKKNGGNGVEI